MANDQNYFNAAINIENYIPSIDDIQNSALTLKSTLVDLVKGRNNNSGLAVHTVTYMKFDEWTSHNQTHYYLIIGTSTGFQVFLLHDSRDRETKPSSQQSSAQNLNPSSQSLQSGSLNTSINNPNVSIPSNSNNSPIINPLAPPPILTSSPRQSPSSGYIYILYPFIISYPYYQYHTFSKAQYQRT